MLKVLTQCLCFLKTQNKSEATTERDSLIDCSLWVSPRPFEPAVSHDLLLKSVCEARIIRGKKCASSYILWLAVYPQEKWWVHDLLLSLKTSDAGSLFSNKWQLHSKEKNNTQLKVERTWLQNLLFLCRRPSSFFLSSLDIFHLKNFHLLFCRFHKR